MVQTNIQTTDIGDLFENANKFNLEFLGKLDAALAFDPPQIEIAQSLICYHKEITKRVKTFWEDQEEGLDK